MVVAIFRFFIYFLIFSLPCSYAQASNYPQKKILFLGDSFTVGTGLKAGREQNAFPYQLIKMLKAKHIVLDVPKIYAVDGDTTKHLLGALNAMEPQSNPENPSYRSGNYDLVILSIGINDLFRGHDLDDYTHHFEELLERAIYFANNDPARVIVLSIPAWDASPSVYYQNGTKFRANKYALVRRRMNHISIPVNTIEIDDNGTIQFILGQETNKQKIKVAKHYNAQDGIANEIDNFNAAAQKVIKKKNMIRGQGEIHFIDLTNLTRRDVLDLTGKPISSLFAEDGIHYSEKMYTKWAREAYPIAYHVLKK